MSPVINIVNFAHFDVSASIRLAGYASIIFTSSDLNCITSSDLIRLTGSNLIGLTIPDLFDSLFLTGFKSPFLTLFLTVAEQKMPGGKTSDQGARESSTP